MGIGRARSPGRAGSGAKPAGPSTLSLRSKQKYSTYSDGRGPDGPDDGWYSGRSGSLLKGRHLQNGRTGILRYTVGLEASERAAAPSELLLGDPRRPNCRCVLSTAWSEGELARDSGRLC